MIEQPAGSLAQTSGAAEQEHARLVDPELESLATGIELTLASVLQGIAVAILIPQIVDLIRAGELAKLPYIPASLLLIFIVWVAFIMHSISLSSWPFDPIHNMLYFVIVTAEMVLLAFLEQPAEWFLALAVFGMLMSVNYWYNERLLDRQRRLATTPAAQTLHDHIAYDQRVTLQFMAGYVVAGLLGFGALSLWPEFGLAPEPGWVVAGLLAMILPVIHVIWQTRMVLRRAYFLEQVRAEAAGHESD